MGKISKLNRRRLFWGCLGFFGTVILGLVVSYILDLIYPGGPGPGSLAFMMSIVLAPVMAMAGTSLGSSISKRKDRGDRN